MSIERALQKIAKEKKVQRGALSLSGLRLNKVPKEILDLNHLHDLNLSGNKISDLQLLKKLTNLKTLNLGLNEVSDISFLEKLTSLESLHLSYNKISDIRFLEKLTNLKALDLSSNQISDIRFLEKLTNLKALNLSSNQISDIQFLKNLTNLKALDLSANRILDIESLWNLIQLIIIHRSKVRIVGGLKLYDNPIINPPIEVVAKGNEAIIQYFKDLAQQGKDYLYEAKMLIIGDGGVGKTSLAWKMKDLQADMPKEGNDRTKGIDIQALPVQNIKDADKSFLMNVWDFGGQGYYHSTHQFFLTKRSLYVIVNNTRSNKTDFNHWLQTISLFSEDSPVVIVENEVGGAKSELDLRGLQQHFSNILYVREADISNITDGRLKKLISDLGIEVQRLPHVGSELPKQWVKIREELAEVAQKEAYISDKEFHKICRKHQITKREAIQRLGDLFHDLGIFLHFRSDAILKRTVILQNSWATKGVYEILDSGLVREQKGYFTIKQAQSIWADTQFKDMCHELVRLMTKFELCYRIPYTNNPAAYISPNLLPTEKPDYQWSNHQNLLIYYQYEFMPKGLLGRLIVRIHRYVKDIHNMAWRNGCVFEYEETEAQVVETYGHKKLEIRVWGKHCVRLSSIVIREIDELNEGFKRIKVKKKLPCNCMTCQKLERPHFYDYQDLMKRKAKGKYTIECAESYDDVLVVQVLEGVYNEAAARELSVKELIRKGKTREAIDVLEEKHPDEAILLMARFSKGKMDYHKGVMSEANWRIEEQKIAEAVLKISEREV